MFARSHRRPPGAPRIRAAAFGLAAVAMVLKLLFSPGLMPALDVQGGATLIICTGQGAKLIPDPAGHAGEVQKHCPFEAQAAMATAELPQLLQLASVEYPATPFAVETTVAPGLGLSAPPPPSTGPPLQRA